MPVFEYKVVPAPTKGLKAKGVRKAEDRFSYALQELMNDLSREGWEYQRAETLPSIERSGLTGSTTEWRNVLVFRRPQENAPDALRPELLPPPAAAPAPEDKADAPPEMKLDKTAEAPAEPPLKTPVKTAEEATPAADTTSSEDTPNFTAAKALSAARNASKTET